YIPVFKKVVLILFGLLLVLGLIYFFLSSDCFAISKVDVKGTHEYVNAKDVYEVSLSSSVDKNIFLFKTTDLEEKLTTNYLGAKSFKVTKKFPHTLLIDVMERFPIAIVHDEKEENFYLVDDEGYVLGYTEKENQQYPILKYKGEISVGLFIDKNIVPLYLELTNLLSDNSVRVTSISFDPRSVNFYVENGVEVLLGRDKNVFEAIQAISALVKKAETSEEEISRIDLRYDKVIVSFK
ncbi:MAG: cell division protein FtsQ/DivIB, partial [Paludibacteraceae bacterium]|nr:cell division protein FtsQ/DivIB [Paludibacteraceae bacterium]